MKLEPFSKEKQNRRVYKNKNVPKADASRRYQMQIPTSPETQATATPPGFIKYFTSANSSIITIISHPQGAQKFPFFERLASLLSQCIAFLNKGPPFNKGQTSDKGNCHLQSVVSAPGPPQSMYSQKPTWWCTKLIHWSVEEWKKTLMSKMPPGAQWGKNGINLYLGTWAAALNLGLVSWVTLI